MNVRDDIVGHLRLRHLDLEDQLQQIVFVRSQIDRPLQLGKLRAERVDEDVADVLLDVVVALLRGEAVD